MKNTLFEIMIAVYAWLMVVTAEFSGPNSVQENFGNPLENLVGGILGFARIFFCIVLAILIASKLANTLCELCGKGEAFFRRKINIRLALFCAIYIAVMGMIGSLITGRFIIVIALYIFEIFCVSNLYQRIGDTVAK